MSKFTESLKVQLTEEEIRTAAEKLAKFTDDIEGKEAEKKSVASQFKADIDNLVSNARTEAALVRNKYTYRQVECHEHFDYPCKSVTVFRDDTGEEIRTRTITTSECQSELPLVDTDDEQP